MSNPREHLLEQPITAPERTPITVFIKKAEKHKKEHDAANKLLFQSSFESILND